MVRVSDKETQVWIPTLLWKLAGWLKAGHTLSAYLTIKCCCGNKMEDRRMMQAAFVPLGRKAKYKWSKEINATTSKGTSSPTIVPRGGGIQFWQKLEVMLLWHSRIHEVKLFWLIPSLALTSCLHQKWCHSNAKFGRSLLLTISCQILAQTLFYIFLPSLL